MEKHNDYIERTCVAIGRAIAKIIGLKEKGQYTQAMEELHYNHLLYFDDFSLEDESDFKMLDLYGSFLFEKIELMFEVNNLEEVGSLIQKSLELLKKARELSKTYDFQREKKIEKLTILLTNIQ